MFTGLFSTDNAESKKALKIILAARKTHKKSKIPRKFNLPKHHEINFEAQRPMELLKWDEFSPEDIHAPPLLQEISDEDLKNISIDDIPFLKSHSQAKISFVAKYQCITQ